MKYGLFLFALIAIAQTGFSQTATESALVQKNKLYTGAKASGVESKVIYQLDTDDPKIIGKTIRNINNAITDPRLKGHLKIELVTYAGGTQALLKKNSQYQEPIKDLINKGVIVAQCENSIREQGRTKAEFFDFIGYTPSGNGELIIRAQQGWAIVKP